MIHKRKGVTLAEMSIVMAVIAIVSLSVVSFVTITSGRGTAGIAKLNAMEEIELVEAIVDSWFVQVAQASETIKINEYGQISTNNSSAISMSYEKIQVMFPKEEKPTDYYLEKVTKVSFSQLLLTESGECKETLDEKDIVKDVLYFCTVKYEREEGAAEQTYTFCINPRVGEIVEESNSNTGGTNGEAGGETPSEGPSEAPSEETSKSDEGQE